MAGTLGPDFAVLGPGSVRSRVRVFVFFFLLMPPKMALGIEVKCVFRAGLLFRAGPCGLFRAGCFRAGLFRAGLLRAGFV